MRSSFAILVGLCFGGIACERPTAAEFARESDRVQREMLIESADPASVWNLFGLDQLIDHLPGAGSLEVRIDGRRRRWRAFVLERVFVRDDLAAAPECPLVTRAIFAGNGPDGLIVVSAAGPSAIRPLKACTPSPGLPGGSAPVSANEAYALVMTGGCQGTEGRVGTVEIRVLANEGASCGFLDMRDDENEPLDVSCESFRYALRAEANLQGSRWPTKLPPGPRLLTVPQQELPGMRITVRCNDRSESIGGCERG
jgi:hypothetical protein